MGDMAAVPDAVGTDIDVQISTEDGEELLSGIIIDVRELSNGSAEMDICLEDGDIATIAMSSRQYAGFLGAENPSLPLPN